MMSLVNRETSDMMSYGGDIKWQMNFMGDKLQRMMVAAHHLYGNM